MPKPIIAIDPGSAQSAYVIWDGKTILHSAKVANAELLQSLLNITEPAGDLYVEMVACYGMAVGAEVFETCVWIGRFIQAWEGSSARIFRKEIKLHHCGQTRAKDSNIIRALKDKYGEKGTKKNPGITFPLKADVWQAFALATFIWETQKKL